MGGALPRLAPARAPRPGCLSPRADLTDYLADLDEGLRRLDQGAHGQARHPLLH